MREARLDVAAAAKERDCRDVAVDDARREVVARLGGDDARAARLGVGEQRGGDAASSRRRDRRRGCARTCRTSRPRLACRRNTRTHGGPATPRPKHFSSATAARSYGASFARAKSAQRGQIVRRRRADHARILPRAGGRLSARCLSAAVRAPEPASARGGGDSHCGFSDGCSGRQMSRVRTGQPRSSARQRQEGRLREMQSAARVATAWSC